MTHGLQRQLPGRMIQGPVNVNVLGTSSESITLSEPTICTSSADTQLARVLHVLSKAVALSTKCLEEHLQ